MCPYCFPIPVCLKEVPVWFFCQQKQHSAEKNCSKTGLLDLNWFKELLRSLALIFFFFLRDLVLFKGQSPKIYLQRFSPGLSVSHFPPVEARGDCQHFPCCAPFFLSTWSTGNQGTWTRRSCHLFCNGKWRERRGNLGWHLYSRILNGAELLWVLQPSSFLSPQGWEAKPFTPWVEGIGWATMSLK